MFDECHPSIPSVDAHVAYSLGKIADHNIVACLPTGVYGTTSATAVVSHIKSTFPNIHSGLMVGIAGGMPSDTAVIKLGDVVVSKPMGPLEGVVQYDSWRQPIPAHRNAQSAADCSLDCSLGYEGIFTDKAIRQHLQNDDRNLRAVSNHAGRVFQTSSIEDCIVDSGSPTMKRNLPRRPLGEPQVHYGIVASGKRVLPNFKHSRFLSA